MSRRRPRPESTAARVLVGLVGAILAALPLVLAPTGTVAAGAAARSGPPHPPGTTAQVERPLVYPGGGVVAFGDAPTITPAITTALNAPVVAMARTPDGKGMWLAGADGGVYSAGDATFYGSTGALTLTGPVVGMSGTADGEGYWLVALDGGVFAFGDAQFHGSMGGIPLNQPIVGMATAPAGKGYWLVAADGGIFAFGDAPFYGSTGGQVIPGPIVAMAPTPDGKGYWLVGGDGSVYAFGDARFYGDAANVPLQASIAGMASTPDGGGYWLVGTDGGIFNFGDAVFLGSGRATAAATPFDQIVSTPDGQGYWLLDPDAWSYSFTNPPPDGTFPGSGAIVAAADSQVQPDPDTGYFCNPYGPCEEWCALFASWAWEQGGYPVGSDAFTGDLYYWAAANGAVLPPTATPVPGDIVLYGTGPWSTATSVHVGVVAQVWPDGAIVTVEGDAGPGDAGALAVVVNGPYLPWDSAVYNGVPIYAFAQP